MDDEHLKTRLRRGDASVLEDLFDAYGALLHACLMTVTQDEHLAADALQDVFVAIARDPLRVAEAGNLPGYLMRMARNRGIDLLRQRRPTAPAGAEPCTVPVEDHEPERVRAALARLPDDQREVVLLRAIDERSFPEIAQALGIPVNTATSRYRYATAKLREWLADPEPAHVT